MKSRGTMVTPDPILCDITWHDPNHLNTAQLFLNQLDSRTWLDSNRPNSSQLYLNQLDKRIWLVNLTLGKTWIVWWLYLIKAVLIQTI